VSAGDFLKYTLQSTKSDINGNRMLWKLEAKSPSSCLIKCISQLYR